MAEATTDTDRLLAEYEDIWNERAYEKIPTVVAESFVRASPVADEEAKGPDGLAALLRELEASFSDFEVTHHAQLVGEQVAMFESTFTGTHDGEFDGIAPTNETVELPNMSVVEIEAGKIQEHRTYYDPQVLAEQVGGAEK